VFDFEFLDTSLGVSYAVPLRNRTAARAESAARAGLRLARLRYDQEELLVVADVRAAVRDVRFQAEAVAAAEKSVALARRQLAAEQARYKEGLSTTFQVLQFQQQLAETLSSESAARAGYAKALAGLEKAEGHLGEDGGE
jgi:outer membrane protein TolC